MTRDAHHGGETLNLRLPNFLIIGAQKSGTTSMHNMLKNHPFIYLPAKKEIHYFTKHYAIGLNWYSRHFKDAKIEQSCGEATPYYIFHPEAPQRIQALIPRVKLIALLRDPVERTLSAYFHSRRLGLDSLSIEQAFAAEPERVQSGHPTHLQHHSYMRRSQYLEQLDRYEELFPREQILVLKSEEFFKSPSTIWKRIEKFLQIPRAKPPHVTPHCNSGLNEAIEVKEELREKLREAHRETARGIEKRYGFSWDWASK